MREEGGNAFKFQWFKPILLVLLIGVMGILAWKSDLPDWTDPILIAGLLEEWGSLAPLVFMLVMAGAVVISPIPSIPLDAVAGAFFGPFLRTGYSILGAEAGALISFFITRTLGKKAVTRWLKSDIGFCGKCEQEKQKAREARDFVKGLILGEVVFLENVKYGKYAGRVVADVKLEGGDNLADKIIQQV